MRFVRIRDPVLNAGKHSRTMTPHSQMGWDFITPLLLVYLIHSLFRAFYGVSAEYPPPHFFSMCVQFLKVGIVPSLPFG